MNFRRLLFRVHPGLRLHVSHFFESSSAFVSLFPCLLCVQRLVFLHPCLGFPLSILFCCRSSCVLSSPEGQVSPAAPHHSTSPLQLDPHTSTSVSVPLNTGCKSRCYCCLHWHPQLRDPQLCLSRWHQRRPHGSSWRRCGAPQSPAERIWCNVNQLARSFPCHLSLSLLSASHSFWM